MSSRASPGGSNALRHRCTRRSLLVTVPSDSHQLGRRREDDLSQLAGLRQKDVLHDQVFQSAQKFVRVLLIGFRLRRVLADDVERIEFASLHRGEHVAEMPAPFAAEASRSMPARTSRGRRGLRRPVRPGNLLGIAPMSPPPCTLFCPRSGLRPDPYRPT